MPANVYDKAIEIIHERGWVQGGEIRGGSGGTCLMLALCEADLNIDWRATLRHLDLTAIIAWNDTPGRTADEVIAKLKLASETYELEHEAALKSPPTP